MPPLSGLVWVVVGCVRVVDALSLFCGAFCVVTLWSLGVTPLSVFLWIWVPFCLGSPSCLLAPQSGADRRMCVRVFPT